jgi:TatA/E family protein of Tat protein translocase
MFDIGAGELLLILIFVLVFFGPKKIPELSRSLGRGIREFKKAQREFADHINTAFAEEEMRSQRMPRPANTIAQRSPRRPSEQEPPPGLAGENPSGGTIPAPEPEAQDQRVPVGAAAVAAPEEPGIPPMEQPAGTVARGSSTASHDRGERDQSNERPTG